MSALRGLLDEPAPLGRAAITLTSAVGECLDFDYSSYRSNWRLYSYIWLSNEFSSETKSSICSFTHSLNVSPSVTGSASKEPGACVIQVSLGKPALPMTTRHTAQTTAPATASALSRGTARVCARVYRLTRGCPAKSTLGSLALTTAQVLAGVRLTGRARVLQDTVDQIVRKCSRPAIAATTAVVSEANARFDILNL